VLATAAGGVIVHSDVTSELIEYDPDGDVVDRSPMPLIDVAAPLAFQRWVGVNPIDGAVSAVNRPTFNEAPVSFRA
jgi:hypothetical protein